MKYTHSRAASLSGLPNITLISTLLLCIGCANPIPPSGGPKDTTPPKLIVEESTPNFLTDFDRNEITLAFDEWIQLKDQNLQIVISPPLARRPEIVLKGKTVIIKFDKDEVLRDQTTYLINFGSSIVDLNEGNALDQFKYVFSTGTFIDSLQIGGTVVDAQNGQPAKQVLIILHDNLSDTAITHLLPAYFTKSLETGQWTIENIRADTFNVYALTDLNLNYRYDQVGEKVGFLGQSVILPDTSGFRPRITLFEELSSISILDVDRRTDGITKITLSGKSTALSLQETDSSRITPLWQLSKDTVLIWNASRDSFQVELSEDGRIIDTVFVNGYSGKIKTQRNVLFTANRILLPSEPFVIQSRVPMASFIDSGIICLRADTILIDSLDIRIDSSDSRNIQIRHPWLEQEKYKITITDGSAVDMFGSVNDSVTVKFQIRPLNSLGQIFIDISGLNDSLQYIVELLHPQSGVVSERIITKATEARVDFPYLPPQTYQIRIIEDANANGRWDTGNLEQQKQPERVLIQALEPLRADWDLEEAIVWELK